MSQTDFLVYIPLLTWYWIIFIIFYYIIFTIFIGTFFHSYRTRFFFFYQILFLVKVNSKYFNKIKFSTLLVKGKKHNPYRFYSANHKFINKINYLIFYTK